MAKHSTVRATASILALAFAVSSLSACTYRLRGDDTAGGTVPMAFERKVELGLIPMDEAIGENPGLQQQYIGPAVDPLHDEAAEPAM
jgi:hypothetical protein